MAPTSTPAIEKRPTAGAAVTSPGAAVSSPSASALGVCTCPDDCQRDHDNE